MADKNKKVQLERAMTWAGIDYAPGENEMPEEAADYAVKREFGTFPDEESESEDAVTADFEPLSFEETMKRFEKMDFSDEVMKSMQFHQETVKAFKDSGLSPDAFMEKLKAENKSYELLPKNFPMRHVFSELGADYDSVEKIQAIGFDDLVKIDGIADASAKKVLAYKR